MTSSQHTKPFARNREIHWYPISQRSDARGNPAAISTRLALRTCSMVVTRTANLSRCVLRWRGSRRANSALIPSAQTAIPLTCVTARSHAGNHTASVHHTQLQPVNHHHGKLMDGEVLEVIQISALTGGEGGIRGDYAILLRFRWLTVFGSKPFVAPFRSRFG